MPVICATSADATIGAVGCTKLKSHTGVGVGDGEVTGAGVEVAVGVALGVGVGEASHEYTTGP